jgi:hypothetical protein
MNAPPNPDPHAEPDDAGEDLLCVLLDVMLPAHADLPSAGSLGLAARVRADAARVPSLHAALAEVMQALPTQLRTDDAQHRLRRLQTIERERPHAFQGVVNLAYNAYYTDRSVLAHIESQTGYIAGAPQPTGYVLPAFDERRLAQMRQRPPSWRRP